MSSKLDAVRLSQEHLKHLDLRLRGAVKPPLVSNHLDCDLTAALVIVGQIYIAKSSPSNSGLNFKAKKDVIFLVQLQPVTLVALN